MIQSVSITNHKNESIEIILTNPETSEFVIGEGGIEGLGPENTNINSTENQIYDGASFDSAITPIKNIVFHLTFDPVDGNIERIRHKCYKYFPVKRLIKIEINTDTRSSYIYGYVESNLPTIFEEREGADISVLCMEPYFKESTDMLSVIKGINSHFEFPFCNDSFEPVLLFGIITNKNSQLILYNGEYETGIKLKIVFSGNINDPVEIVNEDFDQRMVIDMKKIKQYYDNITISDGDYLYIDTSIGSKEIILYQNGEPKDASVGLNINGIKWVMFNPGDNNIIVTTRSSSIIKGIEVENNILYGGV